MICCEFRIEEEADQNMVRKNPNRDEWKMPLELTCFSRSVEVFIEKSQCYLRQS